jgi:hypothetical protein
MLRITGLRAVDTGRCRNSSFEREWNEVRREVEGGERVSVSSESERARR